MTSTTNPSISLVHKKNKDHFTLIISFLNRGVERSASRKNEQTATSKKLTMFFSIIYGNLNQPKPT